VIVSDILVAVDESLRPRRRRGTSSQVVQRMSPIRRRNRTRVSVDLATTGGSGAAVAAALEEAGISDGHSRSSVAEDRIASHADTESKTSGPSALVPDRRAGPRRRERRWATVVICPEQQPDMTGRPSTESSPCGYDQEADDGEMLPSRNGSWDRCGSETRAAHRSPGRPNVGNDRRSSTRS